MAKNHNYRDSGNGRFISPEDAKKRPPNTWEKEKRPSGNKPKGK